MSNIYDIGEQANLIIDDRGHMVVTFTERILIMRTID
jgi:hypothetical protein